MARRCRLNASPGAGLCESCGRISVLAAIILTGAMPAAAHAQSLETALATVYETNPVLQAERAKLRATDEKLPQALSNWRPTVVVSATQGASSYGAASGAPVTPQPDNNFWLGTAPQSYGLTVTQPVYRGGRTDAETSQASNLIRAERAQLVATEQDVFVAAVDAYMNVVLAKSVLDLNKKHQSLLQSELEAARGRLSAGELTQTDVDQAEAAYAGAIAEREAAEDAVKVADAAFFHDVGFQPGGLTPPDEAPLLPATRVEAVYLAEHNNPAVIAASFAVGAGKDNIRLIRGELLPTLTLNARLAQERTPSDNNAQTDTKEVYAELSVPLYDGGKVYSESREAQQTVSQLENVLDEAQRNAVLVASSAFDDKEAQRAALQARQQEIHADQMSLDGVVGEQAVGARTELDVLNAQQTLFQAQLASAQAQHDEIISEFLLEAAVGQMTAANLGIRVAPYDPDENLDLVRHKWWGFKAGGQARTPQPGAAFLPKGGYYELGDPGISPVIPDADVSGGQNYIEAQPSPSAVLPAFAAQRVFTPRATDDAATTAALNDFDHDLSPAPPPNKWLDPAGP